MTSTHISVSLYDTEVTATWAAHINRVILRVEGPRANINWHQSVEEATALRDQLTAAIEKSADGKCTSCRGRGLIRGDDAVLGRCEDCAGEGVVPA